MVQIRERILLPTGMLNGQIILMQLHIPTQQPELFQLWN